MRSALPDVRGNDGENGSSACVMLRRATIPRQLTVILVLPHSRLVTGRIWIKILILLLMIKFIRFQNGLVQYSGQSAINQLYSIQGVTVIIHKTSCVTFIYCSTLYRLVLYFRKNRALQLFISLLYFFYF